MEKANALSQTRSKVFGQRTNTRLLKWHDCYLVLWSRGGGFNLSSGWFGQTQLVANATVDALCHGLEVVGVPLASSKHKQLAVSLHRVVVKPPQSCLTIALAQSQVANRVPGLDTANLNSEGENVFGRTSAMSDALVLSGKVVVVASASSVAEELAPSQALVEVEAWHVSRTNSRVLLLRTHVQLGGGELGQEGQGRLVTAPVQTLVLGQKVVGISLATAINKKLASSLYGIVIISEDFVVTFSTVFGKSACIKVILCDFGGNCSANPEDLNDGGCGGEEALASAARSLDLAHVALSGEVALPAHGVVEQEVEGRTPWRLAAGSVGQGHPHKQPGVIRVVLQVEVGQVLGAVNVQVRQRAHDLLVADELGRFGHTVDVPGQLLGRHTTNLVGFIDARERGMVDKVFSQDDDVAARLFPDVTHSVVGQGGHPRDAGVSRANFHRTIAAEKVVLALANSFFTTSVV